MAATNTARAAAPAAPAADSPAAAPAPAAAPGAPARPNPAAEAVWGAVVANPGGTVNVIAKAAGVKVAVAKSELATLADAGRVAHTAGGRADNGRRVPDTWAPGPDTTTDTAPDTAPDTAATDTAATDTAATDTAATDTASDADASGASNGGADRNADQDADQNGDPAAAPAPEPAVSADTIAEAMRLMAAEAERRAAAEADLAAKIAEEEARREKVLAELTKARRGEDTRRALTDLLGAVTATYAAVVAGDEAAATAGLEKIFTATQTVKVATGATRAAKPRTGNGGGNGGGVSGVVRAAPRPLRPEVIAHLRAHPSSDFTPGEIGRVLDRSSGAVANALDKLVEMKLAVLTTERPARYRLATPAPDGTDTANGTDVPAPSATAGDGPAPTTDATTDADAPASA